MKLKDQVFGWLSGTYGQTIEQIAHFLAEYQGIRTSTEQIEAAIEDLLTEQRVYIIEDHPQPRYRCILPEPGWVEKAKMAISEGLEDCWPSGVGFWFSPEDSNLGCCPLPFDLESEEGLERCRPEVQFDLTPLFKLFESIDHLSFCSRDGNIFFEGQIDGEEAWIEIASDPPPSWETVGIMHSDGAFESYE